MTDIKLTFQLTDKQMGDGPVSTESLWCAAEAGLFRVKNIPFFIDGLSFDDLISVKRRSDESYDIAGIIERSRNSTVWLYLKKESGGRCVLDEVKGLGCGVEGGAVADYFAINVPETVNFKTVQFLLSSGEKAGALIFDVPSMRHSTA
jgi:Domain of unknown function (DUF4265)